MGLFFYTKISSIISIVDLPTTNIIEPSYIENGLKLLIDYAQKEITIDHSSDRDKILMDIGKDPYVVSIKSKVYLQDGRQFQFTESRHKLEKFRFVDFAKRKK
ncbi:trehalose operon repressor [Streptococcus pneumoniae]|nr:trehalose operon repressor [Streptococcus pneumoniae]